MKSFWTDQLSYLATITQFCHPQEMPKLLHCKKCGRELDNVFVGEGGRIFQVKEEMEIEPITTHDGRVMCYPDGRAMADVGYTWTVSEVRGVGLHFCECGNRRKLVAP